MEKGRGRRNNDVVIVVEVVRNSFEGKNEMEGALEHFYVRLANMPLGA